MSHYGTFEKRPVLFYHTFTDFKTHKQSKFKKSTFAICKRIFWLKMDWELKCVCKATSISVGVCPYIMTQDGHSLSWQLSIPMLGVWMCEVWVF